MTGPRCQASRSDGQPCQAPALPDDARCWAHSEATADKRRAARSAGARKSNQLRALRRKEAVLKDLDALAAFASTVILGTLNGRVDVAVARTCLYGASVLRQVLADADLEQRVAALEARVDVHGRAAWAG